MPRAARTASIYRCRRSAMPALPAAARRRSLAATVANPALDALRAAYNRALDDVGADAARGASRLAGARAGRHRSRIFVHGARPRSARRQLHRIAEPQHRSRNSWRRGSRAGARSLSFLQNENLPGSLSVHRRRLSVPARGRRSDAHVRGRGRAGAHQPPLPLPGGRARGHAPVHRVRLDHVVRRRPGPAARHLRPHRQFRAFRSRRSTT